VIGHEGAGEVVAVAQPGKVEVRDRVVVLPISRIQEAFELLAGGECGKVVLQPWA